MTTTFATTEGPRLLFYITHSVYLKEGQLFNLYY